MLDFWRDKKVLITGHSGFKGAWLSSLLLKLGAKVIGVSLPPPNDENLFKILRLENRVDNFFCDIRDFSSFKAAVNKSKPNIIFHLAAQSLVIDGYKDPLDTFRTNTIGTLNLLEIIRLSPDANVCVLVSTDKVYKDLGHNHFFTESDPIGGFDPYSASKSAAEVIADSYIKSFLSGADVRLGIARAGNVIGGGDWSQNRLIPDIIKAWRRGESISIRNPKAIRPWQHVLEPLMGYLLLAEMLWTTPNIEPHFNFAPMAEAHLEVQELIGLATAQIPNCGVKVNFISGQFDEQFLLALDNARAENELGHRTKLSIKQAIEITMRWYIDYYDNKNPLQMTERDLEYYLRLN